MLSRCGEQTLWSDMVDARGSFSVFLLQIRVRLPLKHHQTVLFPSALENDGHILGVLLSKADKSSSLSWVSE